MNGKRVESILVNTNISITGTFIMIISSDNCVLISDVILDIGHDVTK